MKKGIFILVVFMILLGTFSILVGLGLINIISSTHHMRYVLGGTFVVLFGVGILTYNPLKRISGPLYRDEDNKNMPDLWRKGILFIGISIIIPSLLVFAYLGSYSRFIADDYCSAAKAISKGLFGGTVYWYLQWSGRFSANFLDTLMGLLGPRITPFVSFTVIVIWLIVLIVVLQLLIASSLNRTYFTVTLLLAAILLSATLIITPNVAQSLYWGPGMRSVIPPLILGTAFFGLVLYRHKKILKKTWAWFAVAGMLTFVAGGFSETFVALQTFMLAVITFLGIAFVLYNQKKGLDVSEYKKTLLPVIVFGLLCSILSMVIVIIAPGNKGRQANLPAPPGVLRIIEISGMSMVQFVEKIIFSPEKLICILGVVGFSAILGAGLIVDKTPDVNSKQVITRVLLWLPLFTILLIYVCFAPAAYGLSSSPPGRTGIIPTYIVVCALALWGYFLGLFFRPSGRLRVGATRPFQFFMVAILVLFVLSLLNTIDVSYVALQNQPEFNSYAMNWDRVDQIIRQAKMEGQDSVVVMPVYNQFGLNDFGEDPKNWVNICVSSYYGLAVKTDNSLK